MKDHLRRAALVPVMAVAVVLLGSTAALAVPPDPTALASGLADTGGNALLDALTGVLPVVIPFMVALWAVGFVWKKVKPKGGGIK